MMLLRTFTTILLVITTLLSIAQDKGRIPDAKSVEAYAVVDSTSPSITIHWKVSELTDLIRVFRAVKGSSEPAKFLVGRQENEDTFYVDTDVKLGETYIYSVGDITNVVDPFDEFDVIEGFGIVEASINKPAVHQIGNMLLLIEKSIQDNLSVEIATLIADLAGDGWNVSAEVVNANDDVTAVKEIITNKKETVGCDAIYLLGHVPVPYSGTFCTDPAVQFPPDGHTPATPPSHCGAWAADIYYANFTEVWTDTRTDTSAARQANKNFPNDGKFDNNFLASPGSIPLGRVDFSNLPLFEKTEIELTRQYLQKAHDFKLGLTQVAQKGVIEDNFKTGGGSREGFSSGAIRDFTSILGENAIIYSDVLEASQTEDYLFSYACGAGSYTSCSGFGNSEDFKTKNTAVF
jgi:hypothetical protein